MFKQLAEKPGLSLERLRSFVLVAEAGSIAKAVPHDLNRQSQFSRQIHELEEFFATELTRRKGKGIVLTEAGRRLAFLVRQQFQDLEDFCVDQARHPETRIFTVGAGTSVLEWLVAPVAPLISAALGNASLRLESFRSAAVAEAVREGRIDFGVVRANAVPPGQKRRRLRQLTFHLCVPRKLLPPSVSNADLTKPQIWRTLPFAAGKDGGQLDQAIRQAMASHGVDFRPRFECISVLLVRQFIEQGHCAGILPSVGLAGLSPRQFAMVEFPPLKELGRSLVLHWNERQIRRRGVSETAIAAICAALRTPS